MIARERRVYVVRDEEALAGVNGKEAAAKGDEKKNNTFKCRRGNIFIKDAPPALI